MFRHDLRHHWHYIYRSPTHPPVRSPYSPSTCTSSSGHAAGSSASPASTAREVARPCTCSTAAGCTTTRSCLQAPSGPAQRRREIRSRWEWGSGWGWRWGWGWDSVRVSRARARRGSSANIITITSNSGRTSISTSISTNGNINTSSSERRRRRMAVAAAEGRSSAVVGPSGGRPTRPVSGSLRTSLGLWRSGGLEVSEWRSPPMSRGRRVAHAGGYLVLALCAPEY